MNKIQYDKEEYVLKYWNLITKSRNPILIADGGPYFISPDAVLGLRFSDNGINFKATFNGIERLVCLFKDDIEDLVDGEENGYGK